MYINIHIYTHTRIAYTNTHDNLTTSKASSGARVARIYKYIYAYLYIYIHIYVYGYTHTHTYIYICKYMYTCIYIHTHTHAYDNLTTSKASSEGKVARKLRNQQKSVFQRTEEFGPEAPRGRADYDM